MPSKFQDRRRDADAGLVASATRPRGMTLRALAALAPLLLLVACAEGKGPTAYPSLATVPSRPQPADTLSQRAALAATLTREGAAVRGEAAALPPTVGAGPGLQAPLPPQPTVANRSRKPQPAAATDETALAYVKEGMARAQDDGSLKDFLRQMERPAPGVLRPDSAAHVLGLTSGAPATPEAAARGTFVGRLTFRPRTETLVAVDEAALRAAAATARAPATLRVIVNGNDVAEREARAEVVASELVRLGGLRRAVRTLQGGDGDEAEVYSMVGGPPA